MYIFFRYKINRFIYRQTLMSIRNKTWVLFKWASGLIHASVTKRSSDESRWLRKCQEKITLVKKSESETDDMWKDIYLSVEFAEKVVFLSLQLRYDVSLLYRLVYPTCIRLWHPSYHQNKYFRHFSTNVKWGASADTWRLLAYLLT